MLKNFLENIENNPVLIAEAIRLVMPILQMFGLINLTLEQQTVTFVGVSGLMALFVRNNTVSIPKIDLRVEERMAQREMAGTTGTGEGMTATETPGPATKGMMILLAASLSLAACGPKLPLNTSPEGKVAVRATQVVAALRATLPGLKVIVCQTNVPSPCVRPADAIQIVTKIEQAADMATQLGQALLIVDTVTLVDDKIAAMAKARNILVNVQSLLTAASIIPDNEEARQIVSQLFSNTTTLLFAVQR